MYWTYAGYLLGHLFGFAVLMFWDVPTSAAEAVSTLLAFAMIIVASCAICSVVGVPKAERALIRLLFRTGQLSWRRAWWMGFQIGTVMVAIMMALCVVLARTGQEDLGVVVLATCIFGGGLAAKERLAFLARHAIGQGARSDE
jgi:hypothetical protein